MTPDQATPSQGDVPYDIIDATEADWIEARAVVEQWLAARGGTGSHLQGKKMLVQTLSVAFATARAESRAEVVPPIDSAMELAELVTMNEGDYPVTATSGVLRAFFDDAEHTDAALEEAMARAEAAEAEVQSLTERLDEITPHAEVAASLRKHLQEAQDARRDAEAEVLIVQQRIDGALAIIDNLHAKLVAAEASARKAGEGMRERCVRISATVVVPHNEQAEIEVAKTQTPVAAAGYFRARGENEMREAIGNAIAALPLPGDGDAERVGYHARKIR